MMRCQLRALGSAFVATLLSTTVAQAQDATTREGCTQGDLVACVRVDVSRMFNASETSLSLTVSHLGVYAPMELTSQPSMFWSLAFSTGISTFSDYVEHEALLTPTGSAQLTDNTSWVLGDQGDLWSLYFPSWEDPDFTTRGVGDAIVASTDFIDSQSFPWRQIANTSADGGITFSTTLPYLWEVSLNDFQIAGLEAVSLSTDAAGRELPAGSCGGDVLCGSVPRNTVPEPSSLLLLVAGLGALLLVLNARSSMNATPGREVPS